MLLLGFKYLISEYSNCFFLLIDDSNTSTCKLSVVKFVVVFLIYITSLLKFKRENKILKSHEINLQIIFVHM